MPIPQASHSNSNTLSKIGKAMIGALVSFSLISSKPLPASTFQTKTPLFKQSVMGATKLLRLQMKMLVEIS